MKIHEGKRDYGPCEPSVAVNPNKPTQVVVGSVLNDIFVSDDAGKTWSTDTLSSRYGVWGDPCLLADYDNHFYYFHLSSTGNQGRESEDWLERIVCQRSDDGSRSWSRGTSIGYHGTHDQDKEWATVNPQNNHLYISWTEFDKYGSRDPRDSSFILLSKSTNQGRTWSKPKRINQKAGNCLDDDRTVEGAVPTVGPEGQVYVAWAYNDTLYFDRSTDEGKTWLAQDIVVADQPRGWSQTIDGMDRCNGMPVTVCDISNSPHRGTIYVNWTDQRNGRDDTDVWISKSNDSGTTWSEPIRVNDDEAGHQQFLTWMALDPTTGYLYVVFYDRRNTKGKDTDVYLAYSTDGGENFTNLKLTDQPFTLNDASVFFGDYNNIAAYGGHIYPVWTQQKGKKLSVWTALIRHKDLSLNSSQ
uniref:Sialidase family protein n=1 Tax=Roseihalotalea indica TaxID=2867963 RepID=A0AA49JJ72_9BACT|nr:sialidase family protein [Tunicatimonas sp. TK19036]